MRKVLFTGIVLLLGTLVLKGISPYLRIAELNGGMDAVRHQIESRLSEMGYDILGHYSPGGNPDLHVVVFSNDQLSTLCKSSDNRGMLAAAMKVGFQKKNGKIIVSIVNPEYLFYAYFRERMEDSSFKSAAISASNKIIKDLEGVGPLKQPFGGDLELKDLVKYRYMVGMPDFDDPVDLAEFESFDDGLATIRRNLTAGKGNAVQVYEIVDQKNKIAVIGVGLLEKETGEAHFLSIIGESHVAAMPYEIILQGKEASMLHGRFRFALHWPELTMKTFTKIMSSPGDVKDALEALMD